MGKTRIGFAVAVLLAASCATVEQFPLAKDAEAASRVVLAENAGVVEKHAAAELSTYLGKITGAAVEVASAPAKDKYNIYIGTLESRNIPLTAEMKARLPELKEDGYMLAADNDGLRVVGRNPRGALYGIYGLLKRDGNVRWFFPGPEGEYCPRNPNFAVSSGVTVSNPAFSQRTFNFVCANVDSKILDTCDWMVRNGMQIKTNKLLRKIACPEERERRGGEYIGGKEVFSYLISDKLFDEHPEYFPLIGGKRVRQSIPGMGCRNQPCTSNPKVVEIMTGKLLEWGEIAPRGGEFLIGNNDGLGWCQCGNCAKLDPPAEREKNFVSTRYWTLLNAMAEKALAKNPELKLQGWGYQNFQEPPLGIVPDKRFQVELCVHQRCYRHRMDDGKCPSNGRFRDMLGKWAKLNPTSTYEYTNCLPGGDVLYLPLERSFAADLKYYHKIGLRGALTEMAPPDGVFGPTWNNRKTKEMWLANWQFVYMMAYFLWDVDADYDAVYEDMGSKFYGATWPIMKQYREKLAKAYEDTPGCMIYGTPDIALGKCLEPPGLEAALLKLLDAAEQAAGNDAALLRKVRREREYFALSWQQVHKEYVAKPKLAELGAARRTDKVAVDGKLDEPDWKKADFISGFISANGKKKELADPRTFVRILYDTDNVYVGVEALEPEPGKMKASCERRDSALWTDNGVEIFLAAPDGSGKYLHLIVNSKGVVYDAKAAGTGPSDTAFDAGAEVKTAVFPDRWTLEARIPAAAFDTTINDGEVWKINVARNRLLITDGAARESSLCEGAYHGVEAFRALVFGGKGLVQNGDFEDAEKPSEWKDKTPWKFTTDSAPSKWLFHQCAGEAALLEGGAASGSKFLRVKSGSDKSSAIVFQPLNISGAASLLVRAKARGKGALSAVMFLYDKKTNRYLGSPSFGEKLPVDSKDWKNFEAVYKHDGKTLLMLALCLSSSQGIDIDDVTVTRQAPPRR